MLEINQVDTRVNAFITALSPLYVHGDVIFRGYTASNNKPWDEYSSDPQAILKHILSIVPDLIPELKAPCFSNVPQHTIIKPYELAEGLSSLLTFGGCYEKFSGTHADARKLAQSFVNAILGAEWTSALIFTFYDQWTPWFSCIIYETYLVVLPVERQWFIFCATDED